MRLTRRSETHDDRPELRARIVQLTAENERLAENVRMLSMELCTRSIEYRDLRRTYEWATDDL
jgi:hypothetical protein